MFVRSDNLPLRTGLQVAILVGLQFSTVSASVLVEAHRGDSAAAPENTLAAIQSALGAADLTEMDVRVTVDGQLVLMHDASVNRTTDGRGAVKRKTVSELRSLDAGSWFSDDFIGEPVPTLEQAVNHALMSGIEPLIERKSGAAELFHDEFTRLNLDELEFRVISFSRGFIDELDQLNPAYQLGILGSGPITQTKLNRLADRGADFISWRHNNVRSQTTVDLVHDHGMELHVWTVNGSVRMQELIDLGVDGITTDYPHLLRNLLEPPGMVAPSSMATVVLIPEPAALPLHLAVCLALLARRRRA